MLEQVLKETIRSGQLRLLMPDGNEYFFGEHWRCRARLAY